jgi:hypothetical protein
MLNTKSSASADRRRGRESPPCARVPLCRPELSAAHLIEPGTADRYHYLNPVRVFARGRALLDDGQAECHAALARLTRFYVATVRNALLATDPGRTLPDAEPGGLTFANADAARTRILLEHEHLWSAAAQTASIPDAPAADLARMIGREVQPWQDSLEHWFPHDVEPLLLPD